MSINKLFKNNARIDLVFYFSLILKALNAGLEIIGGIAILFINQTAVLDVVTLLTQEELTEDPRDRIANYFLHAAEHLSIGMKEFAAFYLLSHGVIKLFLIANLFKRKLWAYPASLSVFALFILYQLYRYTDTHSLTLILLTIFDVFVMILVYKEYKKLKALNVAIRSS